MVKDSSWEVLPHVIWSSISALAKPSGIDIEYDFRPTHDEVEDDWINEMAAIDIAAHDL